MTDEQQWLPFDEVQVIQQVAPIPHFENPSNDNERLLEYQYQYKVNGKREALASLYILGCEVCEKFISVETRKNRHIKKLSVEERSEKASDAVNYVISSYLKKPEWFIKKNLPGYLFKRVQHELYYQTKAQEIVDFVDFGEFYKTGEENEFDDWEDE